MFLLAIRFPKIIHLHKHNWCIPFLVRSPSWNVLSCQLQQCCTSAGTCRPCTPYPLSAQGHMLCAILFLICREHKIGSTWDLALITWLCPVAEPTLKKNVSFFQWGVIKTVNEYSQRKACIPHGLTKIAKLGYVIPFIIATWKWRILKFSRNLFNHFSRAELVKNKSNVITISAHFLKLLAFALKRLFDACHKKTDLKVFVIVKPKEAWARIWHRLFRIWVFWLRRLYSLKVGVITKEGWACPSFF